MKPKGMGVCVCACVCVMVCVCVCVRVCVVCVCVVCVWVLACDRFSSSLTEENCVSVSVRASFGGLSSYFLLLDFFVRGWKSVQMLACHINKGSVIYNLNKEDHPP